MTLTTELRALIERGLTLGEATNVFAERQQAEEPHLSHYVSAARDRYVDEGVIEIDDHPVVSNSEDGAYVAAWVWVDRESLGDDAEDEAA
jgi:hypothetical protein